MALVAGGAYATLAAVPEGTAMRIPAALGFTAAAAIPEAFLTAYLNLFDLGGLAEGEAVLVHAGASGVGTAAIQMAHCVGAKVLATAGSPEKLELCCSLGAALALHREADDFASAARARTGGAGVDLVLDFVGAPYWARNLEALRPGGRLTLIGFLGGSRGELDLGPILRRSLVVRGTTLRGMAAGAKQDLVTRCAEFLLPRLADGRLRPVLDRAFPLAEAAAAHRWIEANRNRGKVVLET